MIAQLWRARMAVPAMVTTALVGGCGLLGPTPDVAAACADVGKLVDRATRARQSAVRRGPQSVAEQLRELEGQLRDRAESIEDDELHSAVVHLADSYRETAAATSQTRVPDAGQVRRAAYEVDRICLT